MSHVPKGQQHASEHAAACLKVRSDDFTGWPFVEMRDPTPFISMPAVSHLRWDRAMMTRRIARWARHVARGREDLRQACIKVVWIEGGMIGPAGMG